MSAIKCVIGFAIGTAIGVAGGYFIAKRRYEKEIADFKAEYRQHAQKAATDTAKTNEELKAELAAKRENEDREKEKTIDMERYKEHIYKANYATKEKDLSGVRRWDEPYVIDQTDYEDEDYAEYDKDIEFSLFNDGVLLDDADEVMSEDEITATVGRRWIEWFKENPQEDACFVRNDVKKTDYIIARNDENYYAEGEE